MIRTIFATATAAFAAATLASTAAQACLSCEYVPEVVRGHATSPLAYGRGQDDVAHGSYGVYSAKKRFVARSEEVAQPKKTARIEKSGKSEKVAKVSKPEKADPVKVAKAEPVAKKTETNAADSESSSITVASVDDAPKVKAELQPVKETAAKATDCKKFFASVGMTLTVPCE